MKKCYIRYREDLPATTMQYTALKGFQKRGIETEPFYGFGDVYLIDDFGPEVGIAGYLGDTWHALDQLGVKRPPSIDYPSELQKYIRRKMEKMTLKSAMNILDKKLFIKPVKQKLFTGFQCTGKPEDAIKLAPYDEQEMMWVCEPVNFVSEYRCFILEGNIVGVRHYKGDWSVVPDRHTVEQANKDWKNSPASCTLDFGVTDKGDTLLVEANDGYAVGSYGLDPVLYSKIIESRWKELVNL